MTQFRVFAAAWPVVPILAVMFASISATPASAGAFAEARVSLDSAVFVEHIAHHNGAALEHRFSVRVGFNGKRYRGQLHRHRRGDMRLRGVIMHREILDGIIENRIGPAGKS